MFAPSVMRIHSCPPSFTPGLTTEPRSAVTDVVYALAPMSTLAYYCLPLHAVDFVAHTSAPSPLLLTMDSVNHRDHFLGCCTRSPHESRSQARAQLHCRSVNNFLCSMRGVFAHETPPSRSYRPVHCECRIRLSLSVFHSLASSQGNYAGGGRGARQYLWRRPASSPRSRPLSPMSLSAQASRLSATIAAPHFNHRRF